MTSLLAVLALGFMLGMRHATDPDHVVAVTTIVSGERSVRRAALIGAAWGIGHTLTILLVGSGIILFKWAIPARVGLAMELAGGGEQAAGCLGPAPQLDNGAHQGPAYPLTARSSWAIRRNRLVPECT